MSQRHILFIVGMHRSGTSALCAALERCGASFGPNLLDPMTGVNDEGFWEDAELVKLNQQLLQLVGATWFSLPRGLEAIDWSSDHFAQVREAACDLLRQGHAGAPLEALKDPRLCVTLPFWLHACEELGLPTSVCVIGRAPLEVARSLEKRDGFPPGYGLRLYARYRQLMAVNLPPGTLFVSYDALLLDPVSVMGTLGDQLGLTVPEGGIGATVKPELRHHAELSGDPLLLEADNGRIDLAALAEAIEQAFPSGDTLTAFARAMVHRGEQLTSLGEEHARALATLQQRDADIDGLGLEHRGALATIDERDAQIADFDQRLAATGAHLSKALDTLNERDEQLAQMRRVFAKPVIGWLFRAMWMHEGR